MAYQQITTLLSDFDAKAKKAIAHIKDELAGIRTGRAQTSLVDNIMAEAYGSKMPLVQLATISTPDAKTIAIDPWDKGLMKDIEKAIQLSNLGLAPVVDGKLIRLRLPELTGERRAELTKVMNTRIETGKVAIRNLREESVKLMKKFEDDGEVSEDEAARGKEQLQQKVNAANKEIDTLKAKKEQELMNV